MYPSDINKYVFQFYENRSSSFGGDSNNINCEIYSRTTFRFAQ